MQSCALAGAVLSVAVALAFSCGPERPAAAPNDESRRPDPRPVASSQPIAAQTTLAPPPVPPPALPRPAPEPGPRAPNPIDDRPCDPGPCGPPDEAARVADKARPAFKRCFTDELKRDPNLPDMTAQVSVTLGPTGSVTKAQVTGEIPAELAACLVEVLRKMRLAPPAGGSATISFPLVLKRP